MVFSHHLDVKFLLFLSTKKLLAPFTPGQKKQSESRRASRQLANFIPPYTFGPTKNASNFLSLVTYFMRSLLHFDLTVCAHQ